MKAVESSFSYRAVGAAWRRASRCAACSLTGRALLRSGRALRPVLADSHFFGTGRFVSASLDAGSLPLSVSAFAVPTVALQASLARGPAGRGLRGLAAAAPLSGFARGQWSRVLGGALVGLGCGSVLGRPAFAAVLLLVGLLLVVAGPWLLAAMEASRLAGVFGWREAAAGASAVGVPGPEAGRVLRASTVGLRGTTWAAMLLAAAGGALAAGGPHTRAVLALAVVIAAAATVLWRPQVVLLAVAAFPWLDWFARRNLGTLGPLWDDALLMVCVALIIWSVVVLGRDTPRSVPVTLPLLFMLAASLGSIVLNRVPGGVGFYALRVLFEPILFYLAGFLIPKSRAWVRWTVGVFLATSTLLALHGLYQYATHAPMPANWVDVTETSIATRAYSVVQNPNVLGGILAMGALVSTGLVLSRALAGIRRLALAGACLVQLGGLAVTFSRGAWIGFVVGLLAMLALAYRRYLIPSVGAGVVIWFAAPRVFVQRLLFGISDTYAAKSSTGLGRLWRWDAALQHIVDKPLLGVGLGTFGGTAAYMLGYWAIWVDNFYLQMAAEGGLLLLLFFLWLLLRSGKGLVRAHGLASDPYLKAVLAGVFGAFLAIVVADFFEADWETLSLGVEFWFLAGLVTSAVLAEPRPLTIPAKDEP
jgi:O-antigen ligase